MDIGCDTDLLFPPHLRSQSLHWAWNYVPFSKPPPSPSNNLNLLNSWKLSLHLHSSVDRMAWRRLLDLFGFCIHSQMDPKLRPSFADIVKTLEEILNRLRNEESERERKLLNLDGPERKPISISKGVSEGGTFLQRLLEMTVVKIKCFMSQGTVPSTHFLQKM